MIDEPQILHTTAQPIAVVRLTVPRSEIRTVMMPAITEVRRTLAEQEVTPAGPWLTHHLRIDLQGYYVATSDQVATFTPRNARLSYTDSLAAFQVAVVPVAGVQGVPRGFIPNVGGTSAVAVNITVNKSIAAPGLLEVAPYDLDDPSTDPWTVGLAYDPDAGDPRANLVTLGVGASGSIKIEPTRIVVSIDLSFVLSGIKGQVETKIKSELERIFKPA